MQKNLPVINAGRVFRQSVLPAVQQGGINTTEYFCFFVCLLDRGRFSPAKLGFFCFQRYNRNGDEGC